MKKPSTSSKAAAPDAPEGAAAPRKSTFNKDKFVERAASTDAPAPRAASPASAARPYYERRPDRTDRTPRPQGGAERQERPERPERFDRADRGTRPDSDRQVRSDRPQGGGRSARPAFGKPAPPRGDFNRDARGTSGRPTRVPSRSTTSRRVKSRVSPRRAFSNTSLMSISATAPPRIRANTSDSAAPIRAPASSA